MEGFCTIKRPKKVIKWSNFNTKLIMGVVRGVSKIPGQIRRVLKMDSCLPGAGFASTAGKHSSIDLSSDFSAHAYCKPGFGKAQMYLCVRFISCIVGVHFRFPVDLTTHYYISADTKNGTLARLYVIGWLQPKILSIFHINKGVEITTFCLFSYIFIASYVF